NENLGHSTARPRIGLQLIIASRWHGKNGRHARHRRDRPYRPKPMTSVGGAITCASSKVLAGQQKFPCPGQINSLPPPRRELRTTHRNYCMNWHLQAPNHTENL